MNLSPAEIRSLEKRGAKISGPPVVNPFHCPGTINRFWIPKWRPTALNRLMFNSVGSRIRLKKADADIVAHYAHECAMPLAGGKRRVSLEIMLTGRMREADIDAYQKVTLDSLVSAGLLLGDRALQVEWGGVRYVRTKGHPFGESGTMIVLEDL